MEISIFRVVQECLTNVYRHSESKTAHIKMWASREKLLIVQVCDEGKGMPFAKRWALSNGTKQGVGLSGMRERVREFGGTLEIQSSEKGTIVTAALPIANTLAIGM